MDVFLRFAGESGIDAGDVSLLRRTTAACGLRGGCGGAEVCAGNTSGECQGQERVDADFACDLAA